MQKRTLFTTEIFLESGLLPISCVHLIVASCVMTIYSRIGVIGLNSETYRNRYVEC